MVGTVGYPRVPYLGMSQLLYLLSQPSKLGLEGLELLEVEIFDLVLLVAKQLEKGELGLLKRLFSPLVCNEEGLVLAGLPLIVRGLALFERFGSRRKRLSLQSGDVLEEALELLVGDVLLPPVG